MGGRVPTLPRIGRRPSSPLLRLGGERDRALEALSTGDLKFFEMAMARLADISVENARALIHDQGPLGLQSVLQAANC